MAEEVHDIVSSDSLPRAIIMMLTGLPPHSRARQVYRIGETRDRFQLAWSTAAATTRSCDIRGGMTRIGTVA